MWKLRPGKRKSFFNSKICSEAGEKKRNGSIPFIRSNSGSTLKDVTLNGNETTDLPPEEEYRSRSHTFTSGVPPKVKKKSLRSCSTPVIVTQTKCPEDIYGSKEDMSVTFSSPRHFLRRRALIESEMEEDLSSSISLHGLTKQVCALQAGQHTDRRENLEEDAGKIMVTVEDGDSKLKELIGAQEAQSLRSLLAPLLPKSSLTGCEVSATCPSGSSLPVDLDAPSTHYASGKVFVEVKTPLQTDTSASPEQLHFTVQQCLDYFQQHGLVELPHMVMDEDSYHLPRVPPTEPIASSWKELPIAQQAKDSLTGKALDQQQALWELIYTEHSHLRQLEVIINLFMRCLELLRRANILTEDSYHNIFGYMEDVYNAHEQFWTWTLQPCLEKVYETSLPLDIEEIIRRFPKPQFGTHFEIYEQHCALQSFNLHSLQKASSNEDFSTYLKWCESHAECHRLKLKDFLVMPMQRLTKYSLLISAVLKETTEPTHRESLEQLVSEVSQFVQSVNQVVAAQEETERIKEAMNQIVGYQAVEIPSELKELMTAYTHLDLLAPMPDVEVDKSRVLMLEGNLKYREQHNTNRMVVHVFLFTDMLLLTKPIRKSAGKHYTIVKPPYKITSLVLHSSEPGSFCVLVLNEYRLLTGWFTLKAHSEEIAQEWMKQINSAQQFYTEAVERKAQNWKLIQSLRSERILNGIEQHLDSLNMAAGLSQSLWSINSNQSHHSRSLSLTASNESLLLPERCSPSISSEQIYHKPVGQTLSGGMKMKLHSHPNIQSNGNIDFSTSLPSWLERTSSLDTLFEKPESGLQSSLSNSCQRIKKMVPRDTRTFPRFRSKSMEPSARPRKSLTELFKQPSSSPVSDVSADSGSEGDPAIIYISGVEEGKFMNNSSHTEDPVEQPEISEAEFTDAVDCNPSDPIPAATVDQPEISEAQFTDAVDYKPSVPIPADTVDQPEISEAQFTDAVDYKPSDPIPADTVDQPEISEAQFTDAVDYKPSVPIPADTVDQPEISEAQFTDAKHCKHELQLSVQSHMHEEQLPFPNVNHNSVTELPAPCAAFDVVLVEPNNSNSSPFLETIDGLVQEANISSVTQKLPVGIPVQSSSQPVTLATDGQTDLKPSVPKNPARQPKSEFSSQKYVSKSILTSSKASFRIPQPAQTSHTPPVGTGESLSHAATPTPETEPQRVASKHKVTFSDEAQQLHRIHRSSDTTSRVNPKSHSEAGSASPDRRSSLPIVGHSVKAGIHHVPPAYKRYTGKSVKQLSEIFEDSAEYAERATNPQKERVATTKVSTTSSSKPAVKPKPTTSTSTGMRGHRRSDPSKKTPEVAHKPISRLHQSKSALDLRRSSTAGATGPTTGHKRVSQTARAEISTKQPTHGVSLKHKKSIVTSISSSKPAKTTKVPSISNANGSAQQKSTTRESPSRGKKSKGTIHTPGQTSHVVQVSAIRAIKGRKSPAEWDKFGRSWSSAGKKYSGGTLDSHAHSDCGFVTTTVTVVVQPEP